MLVFTRKANQQVLIGEQIIVTVIAISGDKVRLGVEAPKEVPVHRREVYEAIHAPAADLPADPPGNVLGSD